MMKFGQNSSQNPIQDPSRSQLKTIALMGLLAVSAVSCMKLGSNVLSTSGSLKTCEMASSNTQSFYSSSIDCSSAHPGASCPITVVNFPGVSLSCYSYTDTIQGTNSGSTNNSGNTSAGGSTTGSSSGSTTGSSTGSATGSTGGTTSGGTTSGGTTSGGTTSGGTTSGGTTSGGTISGGGTTSSGSGSGTGSGTGS